MGKPYRPFGVEKRWRKARRETLQAMAMLLDATWDKPTAMFIKHTLNEINGMGTHWTTYYNSKGEEITHGEAKRRMAMADKRHMKFNDPYARGEDKYHAADALKFAKEAWERKLMEQSKQIPITSEGNIYEKSRPHHISNDTIHVARQSPLPTRK